MNWLTSKKTIGKIKALDVVRIVFIIVAFGINSFSQELSVININSKNGLPTNAVNDVFKDSYGFYWIGTQLGLSRYDGYEVEKIKNNLNDSFSVGCLNIYSIKQYKNYLIVGCENGVSFYDYIKDRFFKFPEIEKELGNSAVFGFFVMADKLCIMSEKGLYEYQFKNKKIRRYALANKNDYELSSDTKLFFNNACFLLTDPNLSIRRIDTVNFIIQEPVKIEHVSGYPKDLIQYGNKIYVAFHNYGVIRMDAHTLKKIDEPIVIKNLSGEFGVDEIISIVSIKNKIYIGYKNGVLEYDPVSSIIEPLHFKDQIHFKDQTEKEQIKKLYNIDNNLVLASYLNGVYMIPLSVKKIINPIPHYINNQYNNTFVIYEYTPDKILIGGDSKLFLYNMIHRRIENDFSDLLKNVYALCLSPSNEKDKYFIGTWGQYLVSLDLKKKKRISIKTNPNVRDILSLLLDNSDTLWCGTLGEGLYKYNTKTEKWLKMNLFQNYSINFIKKADDYYWIATSDNGVFKINKKGETLLHLNTEKKLLSNNTAYCIEEDSNYLYIATDNGLTLYDKKLSKSKFFFESHGIYSSGILSVTKDRKNNLWMSTIKGITKMVLSRLSNPHLKLFYNYTTVDGLMNYEYNQNAYHVLSNGYLIYGGVSGIDILNPLSIKSSFHPIPVYISSFKKNGKDYMLDTSIFLKKYFELDWRQNNFQIELTAINPLSSSKIFYKYRLVGYDDEYSEPTEVRYISYTGLPGGTYQLQVLATNQDGEWNTEPHYIYIKVIPPFWKTPWFIITSSVLLFGGIFGFNQYRTYQMKQRNKELEQKVKERTRELSTKNNEILSSIEYAKRIQQAILPTHKYVQKVVPNAFILYLPKDIVSGDFYWVYEMSDKKENKNKSIVIAAVDCTGHGVPGALMSMIGNNLLNQIVIEKNITAPERILSEMNKGVQSALKQGQGEVQTNDGMDASIVHFQKNGQIQYAGAYRPLIIVRSNGETEKLEGDKSPIGGVQMDTDRTYTLYNIQLQKGDSIYLFSDGYADQFGGEKGKKMMMKKLISHLQKIHMEPPDKQKEILENQFKQWKGNYDQIDDVLVIGMTQM